MKKITLLLVAFAISFATNAQTTITHNSSQTVVAGLGLTCQSSGITTDNQFYGVFDLANDFSITTDWEVLSVEFGVEEVVGAPGDSYPVAINIYTTDSGDPTGTLTLLGSGAGTLSSADGGTVVSMDVDAGTVVPANSVMVVELSVLSDGTTAFRLGATDVASNDDSWIAAADCGLSTPSTYAALGFNDRWHIMNVVGQEYLSVDDNLAEVSSIYPNPMTNVLNVKVPGNVEITNATLFDVLGKDTGAKMINGTMNTANLTAGIYMLKIETSAGTLTQKVIKQ